MSFEINDRNWLITKIKTLRETKGAEKETLKLINKGKKLALKEKNYDFLVTLYWEESLVWQHIVMSSESALSSSEDVVVAKANMSKSASAAYDIIKKYNLVSKEAVGLRFLGRVSDYSEEYQKACDYYLEALNLLPSNSYSKLEIEGFLATSTIMLGDIDTGILMAKKVYADFETSSLGKSLKTHDFYTWLVWRSGIPARVASNLVKTNDFFNKEDIRKWLLECISEIKTPNNEISWGDYKFEFRINELKNSLASLATIILVLMSSNISH